MSYAKMRKTARVTLGYAASLLQKTFYQVLEVSPDIGAHQGIAVGGDNRFLIHTNWIKKTDSSWTVLLENSDVCAECGVAHLGDGAYYDGKIYIAACDWTACPSDWSNSRIAIWDAEDLSFIESHDISTEDFDASGLCVDEANDLIWMTRFCGDGTLIYKYKLSDFSYVGSLTLGTAIPSAQGITLHGSYLHISSNSNVYRVNPSTGAVDTAISVSPADEGLDYTTDKLYVLDGVANKVYTGKILGSPDYQPGVSFEMVIILRENMRTQTEEAARIVSCWGPDQGIYLSKTLGLAFKSAHTSGNTPRPAITADCLPLNVPIHVVAVDNLNHTQLAVNGTIWQDVVRDGTALSAIIGTWIIGSGDGTFMPTVDVEFVRYYASALSASDIAAKYAEYVSGSRSIDERCTGWWDMKPVAGVVPDLSGRGNHGIISGPYNYFGTSSSRTRR